MRDLNPGEIEAVSGSLSQANSDRIGQAMMVAGAVTGDPLLFVCGVVWLSTN